MKYTRKDVIVDPDDVRLEIGAEYFTADSIRTALDLANSGKYGFIVELVDIVDEDSPFLVISNEDNCYVDFLIRRKEPEKKYIPFDLSLEEDRAKLRGTWIRDKDYPQNEDLISAMDSCHVFIGSLPEGISPSDLFTSYEFVDGTPCGKLVEIEE